MYMQMALQTIKLWISGPCIPWHVHVVQYCNDTEVCKVHVNSQPISHYALLTCEEWMATCVLNINISIKLLFVIHIPTVSNDSHTRMHSSLMIPILIWWFPFPNVSNHSHVSDDSHVADDSYISDDSHVSFTAHDCWLSFVLSVVKHHPVHSQIKIYHGNYQAKPTHCTSNHIVCTVNPWFYTCPTRGTVSQSMAAMLPKL